MGLLLLGWSSCEEDLTQDITELSRSAVMETPVADGEKSKPAMETTAPAAPAPVPADPTEAAPVPPPAEAPAVAAVPDTTGQLPMMNVPTFNYIPLPEHSQPLFSRSCLLEEDPGKCSAGLLQQWLYKHLRNTPAELISREGAIEYISFTINEFGDVIDIGHAGTKGSPNKARADAALAAVRGMPTWQPAVRNGKQVRMAVILPVRFDI